MVEHDPVSADSGTKFKMSESLNNKHIRLIVTLHMVGLQRLGVYYMDTGCGLLPVLLLSQT